MPYLTWEETQRELEAERQRQNRMLQLQSQQRAARQTMPLPQIAPITQNVAVPKSSAPQTKITMPQFKPIDLETAKRSQLAITANPNASVDDIKRSMEAYRKASEAQYEADAAQGKYHRIEKGLKSAAMANVGAAANLVPIYLSGKSEEELQQTPGTKLQQQAQIERERALRDLNGAGRLVGDTAISFAQNAPALAVGAVNPTLSLALMGTSAASGRATDLLLQGETKERAQTRGVISGAIEALTEKLPIDNIFKILNGQGGKAFAKNLLKQAGIEGTEESASYLLNFIADKVAKDPNAKFSWDELLNSFAGGVLSGGVSGSVAGGLNVAFNGRDAANPLQTTQNPADSPVENVSGEDILAPAEQGMKQIQTEQKIAKANVQINRRARRALDALGQKIGTQIDFIDTLNGANGIYDPQSKRILIALDSGDPINVVASHEITHRLKETSPEQYEQLKTLMFEAMQSAGTLDAVRNAVQQTYNDASVVDDEMVAHFTQLIVEDIDRFEQLVGVDRNLAQKLLDLLDSFLHSSALAWDSTPGQPIESKAGLFGDLSYHDLENARRKWAEALQNADAGVTGGTDTAYLQSKPVGGKIKYKNISQQAWRQVQRERMSRYGNNFEAMQRIDAFHAHNEMFVIENFDETGFGVIEVIDPALNQEKANIAWEVARNGKIESASSYSRRVKNLRSWRRNYNGDTLRSENAGAGAKNAGLYAWDDGTRAPSETAGKSNNDSGFDLNESSNIKKSLSLSTAYLDAVNRGDNDATQMMVDEAAEIAMPNSAIRGKDGKLIPVYHGTNAKFNVFDTSISGGKNGTSEGYGIYTSDNPEVTSVYGDRQIKMYANIKKPARSDKRTITQAQLAKLIEDTCKKEANQLVEDGSYSSINDALRDTWISNYVYTYDMSMPQAYRETAKSILQMNDNDIEVIQEVMRGLGIRDYAEANKFYRESLTPITGFDGFWSQWENREGDKPSNIILALNSNQLKQADAITYDDNGNVIPLSQRFVPQNVDIRYSRPLAPELIEQNGYIPQGENPANDILLPKKDASGGNVRRLWRTAMESSAADDRLLSQTEEILRKGAEDFSATYEVVTDRSAMDFASDMLEQKGFEGALDEYNAAVASPTDNVPKNISALGSKLFVTAAQNGDYDTAMKIVAQMATDATRAGQQIQAVRLIKKMGPPGQLMAVQQTVDKINREMQESGKSAIVTLPKECVEDILSQKSEKGLNEATERAYKKIAEQMPPSWVDQWNAWRYLAMLGNPRTHIRNLAGNMVFTPAIEMKNVIKQGLEMLPMYKGEKTSAFVSRKKDKKYFDIAEESFSKAKDALSHGGKYNPSDAIRDNRKVFNTGWLETLRKGNSAALEAEDMIFLKRAYVNSMASYLKANRMLENISSEQTKSALIERAANYAAQEAYKATYRDASNAANALNALSRKNKLLGAVVEGVLPFKKTPINILKRGIEYSPAGLLNGIKSTVYDVPKGKKTATEAVEELAAGLTGTGITLLGALLARLGLLNGVGDDDEKQAAFDKLKGEQTYSLTIGDSSYTIDWMAPVALPLFVGVELMKQMEGDDFSFADLANGITNMTEPVYNLSMLSGIQSAIQTAGYSDSPVTDILTGAATGYVGQAVPTLFGQVARTIDGTRRNTYYNDKTSPMPATAQQLINRSVLSKLPFANQMIPPKYDAWGRIDDGGNLGERLLENFVSPGYYSKVEHDPVSDEVQRLYDETGESSVLPSAPQKTYKKNKETFNISAEDYAELSRIKGQTAYNMLDGLFNSSVYDSLSDGEKYLTVQEIQQYATAAAKNELFEVPFSDNKHEQARDLAISGPISADEYLAAAQVLSRIEGDKDSEGETIPLSQAKKKKAEIDSLFPGYSESELEDIYDIFEISERARGGIRELSEGAQEDYRNTFSKLNMSEEDYVRYNNALKGITKKDDRYKALRRAGMTDKQAKHFLSVRYNYKY